MTKRQVLDHGYVELVETWGSDERIVEAARMSTGKGFLGWGPKCRTCGVTFMESGGLDAAPCPNPTLGTPLVDCGAGGHMFDAPGDEKFLAYLYENKHATPFEMAGIVGLAARLRHVAAYQEFGRRLRGVERRAHPQHRNRPHARIPRRQRRVSHG